MQVENAKQQMYGFIQSAIRLTYNDNIRCVESMYEDSVVKFANKVMKDSCHPVFMRYEQLPNGRRWRLPTIITSRFRNSLVPTSIRLVNQ